MNTFESPFARAIVVAATSLALLTACGEEGDKKAPSQVVARVNGKELTVHQLNFVLQRHENPDNATKQKALDSLIDQEILVQKAEELKLDRDPSVVQLIEQAKRELLARAALERLGIKPAEVSAAAINEFYKGNPLLFAERKVYALDNFVVDKAAFNDELKAQLDQSKSAEETRALLEGRGVKFTAQEARRPAEQIPGPLLENVSKLAVGDILIVPEKDKVVLLQLRESMAAPVPEDKAEPVIRRLLASKNKNDAVHSNIKALHGSAKIEYVQKFDTPAAADAAPAASAAGGSADALKEGLKGLK